MSDDQRVRFSVLVDPKQKERVDVVRVPADGPAREVIRRMVALAARIHHVTRPDGTLLFDDIRELLEDAERELNQIYEIRPTSADGSAALVRLRASQEDMA